MAFGFAIYTPQQPPRYPKSKASSLAYLLNKISKEEEFSEEDWNEVVALLSIAAVWLYENTRVEHTPISNQIHIQPKKSKKKSKKKIQE